jgi:hypothetical protein
MRTQRFLSYFWVLLGISSAFWGATLDDFMALCHCFQLVTEFKRGMFAFGFGLE